MSPEGLVKYFELIAEAPNAVPRLRRFILDLAMRGKLVEQNPEDEPAIELLKKIEAEKDQLEKEGTIRKAIPLTMVEGVKIPFEIPLSWKWTRLGETIIDHKGGGTPSKGNSGYWDGEIFWASVKDIGKTKYVDQTMDRITKAGLDNSSSNLIPPGNLLVVTRMGLGKVSINRVPIAINQDLRALFISRLAAIDFYYIFFKTANYEGTGLTVKGIKIEDLLNFPFPLPPLAEQHRIVAKVDELMTLCDELETAQQKRERRRDRLVAATLNGLNNGDDVQENGGQLTLEESARFYFNHLPRLTTCPEHIQQLRQIILNLAVRGKLVPQDPEDEPAFRLIERIKTEMDQGARQGGMKKEPPINEAEAPFKLPRGWAWSRFPELGTFGRGKSKHRPRNDPSLFIQGTHLFVQTGDVARSQGIIKTFTSKYNELGLAQSAKWPAGTLCITIAANIADSGILNFDACFPDSVVGFIPASVFPNARYFEYFMRTVKARLLEFAPATAQKNINLGILNEVLIPLPPLAEQSRIVAKVDELMAVSDEMETRLNSIAKTRRQLLEANIQEALSEESSIDKVFGKN
jgi:type I restriction enzyme S subunit